MLGPMTNPTTDRYLLALAEDLRWQPSVQQLLAGKPAAADLAPALVREIPECWRHLVSTASLAALLTGEAV
jgi:hypothetical protein